VRPIEAVAAGHIRRGDVLAHNGRVLAVTADPSFAWYVDDGGRVLGLMIPCRAGSARWYLYRVGSEIVHRVSDGA
jgi:hypothetical protein